MWCAGIWRGAGPSCTGHLPWLWGSPDLGGCTVKGRIGALEAEQVPSVFDVAQQAFIPMQVVPLTVQFLYSVFVSAITNIKQGYVDKDSTA